VRRRRASQVVGVLVGSALFAGFFFTPALPAFFSAEVFAQGPTGMSKRELFYATTMERLRDPTAYSQAVAAAPESNRNLLLLGSSELSSPAPQNPARFFPHHVSDFDLFISGRGYTQSLYQAISLSATASGSVAVMGNPPSASPREFYVPNLRAGRLRCVAMEGAGGDER